MRIEQVIKTNMHFIIPVLVVAGFGLAYNLLGGAAALLYVAGVIGAVYHFSQPEQTKISVESATSYADELIAEEQAQLAAEAASSSKKDKKKGSKKGASISKKQQAAEDAINASSAADEDDDDDDLLHLAAQQGNAEARARLKLKQESAGGSQGGSGSAGKGGSSKGKARRRRGGTQVDPSPPATTMHAQHGDTATRRHGERGGSGLGVHWREAGKSTPTAQ